MRGRLDVIVKPVKREKVPDVGGTRYWTNDEDSSKGTNGGWEPVRYSSSTIS